MTPDSFLFLTVALIIGAIISTRGTPAHIILVICALLALLINNGMFPTISQFLISPSQAPSQAPSQVQAQSSKRQDFVNLILAVQKQEKASHIDSDFLIAIANAESNWNPTVTSSAGAVGIFQLMPATAKRFEVTDRTDPTQSTQGGIRYIKWLFDRFKGDYSLIAAGYNAGEGAVQRHGGIPPYNETRIYVKRVMGMVAGLKTLRGDWSKRLPICRSID